MANRAILGRISWVLERMHNEAVMKKAPVLAAEAATEGNAFKILIFTMLSSRTKDKTTLKATDRIFSGEKADSPKKILVLGEKKLERILYGVGFYRVKTKNLLAICKILVARDAKIPDDIDGLLRLPGVGRKTANIVLARAFGKNTIGVDVHVHRISNRLGIVKTKKPEGTEQALRLEIPEKYLHQFNRDFVAYGQTICLPRKPACTVCPINQLCLRIGVKENCGSCKYGKR